MQPKRVFLFPTIAAAAAALLSACDAPQPPEEPVETPLAVTRTAAQLPPVRMATARLASASGSSVRGEANFSLSNDAVQMQLTLSGLAPGKHAVHVHEHGDCSAPDAKSAGGHWAPKQSAHGKWGDGAHHLGDIGNLEADEQGKASLRFTTDQWALGNGSPTDIVGRALVVHADADDFESEPAGNAGSRVACGVIKTKT